MANTYTSNVKLAMPTIGDTGWSVPVNGNCTALDGVAAVGGLAVTTHEQPSSSLKVDVAAGAYVKNDRTVGTYAGTGVSPQTMTASTTAVLYLDGTAAWALTAAASYPTTAHVRLATVVTGAATITTITDNRQCFDVVGSILDGTTWTVGSTSGLQIGTATTQKLGFFGATAIVQPGATTDLATGLQNLGLFAAGTHPATLGAVTVTTLGTAGAVTLGDGNNIAVGSTTGTQIATATTQKLGFFGHSPAVQPTMGAATASGTYGATEQGMLQAVYNAVRALGLGS